VHTKRRKAGSGNGRRRKAKGGEPLMKYKGVVDPGHGGSDVGAVGSKSYEKDIALAVSKKIAERLEFHNIETILTRIGDVDVTYPGASAGEELGRRAFIANDFGADFFISVHCNGFGNPAAHGFEIWTSKGDTAADPLATAIYNRMQPGLGLAGRTDYSDGDPDREENYMVLRLTNMPAALIELGFITNPNNEERMLSEAWQNMAADLAVEGVLEYLDINIPTAEEKPVISEPVQSKEDWQDAGIYRKEQI
jgi:N-acetylmuramoyl-L-alanine amidase